MDLLFLGIVPPGNIRKTIHELKFEAFSHSGSTAFYGFPDALVLEFYESPFKKRGWKKGDKKSRNDSSSRTPFEIAQQLKEISSELFQDLPLSFALSGPRATDGRLFLLPSPTLEGTKLAEVLEKFESACGLQKIQAQNSFPKGAILISNQIIPDLREVKELTFKHFDISLRFVASDDSFQNMRAVELATLPKRTGPKRGKP